MRRSQRIVASIDVFAARPPGSSCMLCGAQELGDFSATAPVAAIRFPRPDFAEVRFQIRAGNSPIGYALQGTATLRDGHWRVTRETVARILGTVGMKVRGRSPGSLRSRGGHTHDR